jgi:hypothetical protein
MAAETLMGKPCVRGCGNERYVSGDCVRCARARVRDRRNEDIEKDLAKKREKYKNDPEYRTRRKAASLATYNNRDHDDYRTKRRKRQGLPDPSRPEPVTCECCGRQRGRQALHLDHCHVSGAFRGWLCSDCNLGIGKFGDSIQGLMNAVHYLERAVILTTGRR